MLEAAETGQKLSKKAFATREPELRLALVNAQYDLQSTPSRVIVLIGGDDRHGAAAVFNRLHEWMDARYLITRAFGPPGEEERLRPRFWRHWNALPRRGRIGVYLGSWALSPLAERLEGRLGARGFERSLEQITDFERVLCAEGTVFVKLWIHLPKAEHEKRLAKARKGRGDTWRVDEVDWRICDHYESLAPLAKEALL